MKPLAKIVDCPGTADGYHDYRDFCWTCAPFWEKIPVCPTHGRKLATSGWCRYCRKYYDIAGGHRRNVGGLKTNER